MQKNIVGVFDRNNAQQVRTALLAKGFPESDIHVTESQMDSDDSAVAANSAQPHEKENSFVHFFKDLFGMDDHAASSGYAASYSDAVRRGNCVVAVTIDNDDEIRRVEDIMEDYNAINIDEESADQQKFSSTVSPVVGINAENSLLQDDIAAATHPTDQRNALLRAQSAELQPEKTVLPVINEELQVGKRTVQKGGVRVFSRLTEAPVVQTIELQEQNVSVERQPASRPATEADFAVLKEGQLEVRGMAEEAVVQKTARVVEEIVVDKQASVHTETFRDTVRNTEVTVEKIDDDVDDALPDTSTRH